MIPCGAVWCCVVLCYAVLCGAVWCCVVLCYAVLCGAVWCYVVLCYAVLCGAVWCCVGLCYAVLCGAVWCCAMRCCVVLCYHSMRVNSGRLPSLRESLSSHQTLTERLAVYGLRELPMVGDGNCQFRALADQLFRNANRHAAVRQAVVQQMRAHSERYSPYVPDSFPRYLRHMARNGEWGDHITLQAAADKSYGSASGRKYTTTPSTVQK
ncbi:unnamed protein product, partial [Closterium sp. Naga37s-1]